MRSRFLLLLVALVVSTLYLSGCKGKTATTEVVDVSDESAPPPVEEVVEAPEPEQAPVRDTGRDEGIVIEDFDAQELLDGVFGDVSGLSGVGKYAIRDVLFDYDRYTIREDQRAYLNAGAQILKRFPSASIKVEGHCDERGTSEYNIALGERRANSVKDYLIRLGISADNIRTVSYGEEKPFCREQNKECWQTNRRGHLVIRGR